MKKILILSLTALTALGEALPLLALTIVGVTVLAPADSQALPADRAAGRQGARDSRQTGRQTSRARRRGYYSLPGGAVPFTYGGYHYYRAGARFYYPYMYGGRTVYIDIDVNGGHPAPPPPAGSIDIDLY